MKKFFVTLILMLSIFSITNAHSFKSDKELNEFFSKIDQLIKEELKKIGLNVDKNQIVIDHPISSLGNHFVNINLTKEVILKIIVRLERE